MKKIKLSDISAPIENELQEFNKLFKGSLKSDVKLLNLVLRYLLKQKGKKIRPILVLLSARLSGEINERSYRGAALIELLHTATLVHDDVVDEAQKRRGLPSINYVWKNKIAVLLGDYLLSRGLMLAVEDEDFDFLKVITSTVKRMAEGELLQIHKTRKLDIDEETYFKIISDKTASLLSTCCEVGARSSTENEEKIRALKKYGEYLGIAFQIRDDILDIVGKSSVIGKPLGGDIKEKKITLPLIYALNKADKKKHSEIIKKIRNGKDQANVDKVISFIHEFGGIEYAERVASDYAERAKNELLVFENSETKTSLLSLVDFVIERKK